MPVLSRSIASTRSGLPALTAALTSATCCSGIVKITLMGCVCAMTSSGAFAAADTMLPGSTRRRPMRPEIGAVM